MPSNFLAAFPCERKEGTRRPSSLRLFPPRSLVLVTLVCSMLSTSLVFTSARELAFSPGVVAVMQRGFGSKSHMRFETTSHRTSGANRMAPRGVSRTQQMISQHVRRRSSDLNAGPRCTTPLSLLFPLRARRELVTLRGGAPPEEKEKVEEMMTSEDLQQELSKIVSEISARVEERTGETDEEDWTALAERVEVALLAEALRSRGDHVWVTCFPDRSSPTGVLLDLALRAHLTLSPRAIHLLFAANRWEAAAAIHDKRRRGFNIIVDRYSASGIAYSVAKGLDPAWCKAAEQGLPQPDLTLLLDIDPRVAAARPGYGKELFERVEMQSAVRAAYLSLRGADPDPASWTLLDAHQEEAAVAKQVLAALSRHRRP